MADPTVSMLWESTDAHDTLRRRFGFDSAGAAAAWLRDTLATTHGITVASVDHLVLSAMNLLAYVRTPDDDLLVKCCALAEAHEPLRRLGLLVRWTGQQGVPVSTPLPSRTGDLQTSAGHVTFHVQHRIAGRLLDPADLDQARSAGQTLARLQASLARYPHAGDYPLSDRRTFRHELPHTLAPLARAVDGLLDSYANDVEYSLCHNDFRAANVLQNESVVTAVIDFEETAHNDPLTEVATATVLLATRFRNWRPASLASQDAFHDGYRSVSALSKKQDDRLRLLILRRTLEMTADASGSDAEEAWRSSVSAWYRRAAASFPALGDAGGDAVR